VLYNGWER
jgi:hypothetical protein